MFKKYTFLTVFAAGIMALSLNGCETMEGAGEDVEYAGESIQEAAE